MKGEVKEPVKVCYWYDKHTKLWCVQVVDESMNEIDYEYTPKDTLKWTIGMLCKKYGIRKKVRL